ncbi:MAG: hypothetical protein K2O89_04160 [Clostridia bacterium]|nr:hypothetical protein [Clostridia bacterium]
MIDAVLVRRLNRDATLSEDEKARRTVNVMKIWSEIREIVNGKDEQIIALNTDIDYETEGFTDEYLAVVKEIYVYGVLKLAYEGKDTEPDLRQQGCVKDIVEFVKDAAKERKE